MSASSPSQRFELDGTPKSDEQAAPKPTNEISRQTDSHAASNQTDRQGSLATSHLASPFDQDLFYSAPAETAAEDVYTAEDVPDDQAPAEVPVHPADFKPFFTLIEDRETGAYHHPTVHYIFSDDDPEIFTSALLDTLDETTDYAQPGRPANASQERYVVVDVAADGKTIASASSLSAAWQSIKTDVSLAPSWGNETTGPDRGPMLKISGQESMTRPDLKGGKQPQGHSASMEDLPEAFNERLAALDIALDRNPV